MGWHSDNEKLYGDDPTIGKWTIPLGTASALSQSYAHPASGWPSVWNECMATQQPHCDHIFLPTFSLASCVAFSQQHKIKRQYGWISIHNNICFDILSCLCTHVLLATCVWAEVPAICQGRCSLMGFAAQDLYLLGLQGGLCWGKTRITAISGAMILPLEMCWLWKAARSSTGHTASPRWCVLPNHESTWRFGKFCSQRADSKRHWCFKCIPLHCDKFAAFLSDCLLYHSSGSLLGSADQCSLGSLSNFQAASPERLLNYLLSYQSLNPAFGCMSTTATHCLRHFGARPS